MKVYCRYCKYHTWGHEWGPEGCKENKVLFHNNPLAPYFLERDCSKKNANNDCIYFKPSLFTRLFRKRLLKAMIGKKNED